MVLDCFRSGLISSTNQALIEKARNYGPSIENWSEWIKSFC